MDLKKNYERMFGKIKPLQDNKPFVMTEEHKKRFNTISGIIARKYPNAAITIKEGYVYVGYKKFETVEKFLQRSSLNIQESIRAISMSGKKGLL